MKQGQFPAILPLASLNGQNGFKIDGEMSGDQSGFSVSIAGDVNGDGYADLLIGAMGHANNTGRSYVVFGGPTVGAGGTIALSGLNGTNGFKLDGEVIGDHSGISVSTVGDINSDGYADLLIGAYFHASTTGRSYVVFGAMNVGAGGRISLSSLNGTNGFKLDGELISDRSGISVSGAVDFNSDGHADLVIGAFGYPNSAGVGRSYVIFGGPNVGDGGVILLATVNGTNGIKFDGEASGDYSGNSVSAGGDINGDGRADLLISSPDHTNRTGRSYVAFGGLNVGSGGRVLLSSLNGTNGFKLDGEASGDYGGYPVSAAGDINSDGYADLAFGAFGHANSTGRGYVVFGGLATGVGGIILLSSLNGTNGFKLDGEAAGNNAGISISGAGDINGDGYSDLLIGANVAFTTGRAYVVFGGPRVGNSGLFSLANLNGKNGFKLDGESIGDLSGSAVSQAGDINGDGIGDIVIGAYNHSSGTGRSYVVFGDAPPVLVNNSLSLSVGAAIQLNSTYLAAYDRNHNNNTLIFVPSAVIHGQFELVTESGSPLVNFTQQQITSGAIQFVHDGTLVAPSYNITVRSTGIAWTGPLLAQINFIGAPQSHFPAIIPLADLNGQNGFKIDGEAAGDLSGGMVGTIGDINGDSYDDIFVSAYGKLANAGCTYVIFGKPGIGINGQFNLSSLNGLNGFKINGEQPDDLSGSSSRGIGDFNGDGHNDLIIGAYNASRNGQLISGRSYILFGHSEIGNSGIINLSSLNGSNGFVLPAEMAGDWNGVWVNSAGDVNDDSYADVYIGASRASRRGLGYVGCSYIVFGGPQVGNMGVFNLSSLNGTNGFEVEGEFSGDYTGYINGETGDVNGDGYEDIFISSFESSPGGRSLAGRGYVIFGPLGYVNDGSFNLTTLNGLNGFKINGINPGDHTGSLGAIGDINGDGYEDLMIGAFLASPNGLINAGSNYVIFGSSSIGKGGVIELSDLNLTNGFRIDGEAAGDRSGIFINAANDINSDGYADFFISSDNATSGGLLGAGSNYVIFGSSNIGSNGFFNLTHLDGDNGFKFEGENAGDSSQDLMLTGDVNGDGVNDFLIGAPLHNNKTGRSYVIFGDIPPVLVQNRLIVPSGGNVILNTTFLSAYDRNNNNNTIVFVPTNVTHGYFELISQPGSSLVNFTQPQLINGTVQFVHDGSSFAPSYNMTVYSAGIAWTGPAPANITFILPTTTVVSTPGATPTPTPLSVHPVLLNNQLTLSNGQSVVLSNNNLKASEAGFNNSRLIFVVGNVQNGYFATTPSSTSPSKNITSFTQGQIISGAIEFVSVGNSQSPGYSVLVSDGVQSTVPSTATVYFADAPTITQNTLNITTGETITLTPAMLNLTITDGSSPSQVVLTVSNLQHASITSNVTGLPVSSFTLAQLQADQIQLTQDGNLITPSYTIIAEGVKSQSSAPNQAQVYFSNQGVYAPQLVNNYLQVTQGKSTVLSTRYLSAMQPYGQALDNATQYYIYISEISHGHFSLITQPQTWISFFDQEQLSSGQVQFIQDGSLSIPGYSAAVKAFGLQSASLPAGIFFTPVNEAPPSTSSDGSSDYSTVQKAIIGAVVSGTIGIFFAVFQACLKRAANRKLLHALGEGNETYDREVVSPIARDIARRLKITGFLNATTNKQMMSFKSAVRSLLTALDQRGVDLNLAEMKPVKRDALINEIGRQVERWVKENRRGCTACCPGLTAFFKPQLNPDSLADAAAEIADKIVAARKSQLSLSAKSVGIGQSAVSGSTQKAQCGTGVGRFPLTAIPSAGGSAQ